MEMETTLCREECSFCQLFTAMKLCMHVQMMNHLQKGHEGGKMQKGNYVPEVDINDLTNNLPADMQVKHFSKEELSNFHQDEVDTNFMDGMIPDDLNTLIASHEVEESNDTSAQVIKTELISAHASSEYTDLRQKNEDSYDDSNLKVKIEDHYNDNLYIGTINSNSTKPRDPIQVSQKNIPKEEYSCKECTQFFSKKNDLRNHTSRKHRDFKKTFLCDICSKQFSRPDHLSHHKKIHNVKRIKDYKCDDCTKSFFTKETLRNHKIIHSGEKPFHCDQCTKSFLSKGTLKTHKIIHSEENPFCCDLCGQNFRQNGALKNHQLKEHGSSSLVEQYSCNYCLKSFFAASYLRKHELVHTGEKPFSCDVCLKAFGNTSHLSIHKRIHTGERPFQCDKCPKSFRSSGKLNTHKRVHTGVKPYSCILCSKSFSQSNTLKIHTKSCKNK